ncbi:MAG TPA: aminomethyltransferase family protein [Terriglobia bacterium]|nr:aminomethyltransferase family protein [Terriglobia bacterium]
MSSEPTEIVTIQSPLADLYAIAVTEVSSPPSSPVPLVTYHGAGIPVRFSEAAAEHRSVRSAAGLFDFSFRSKFTLTGEHRTRFLHRIISNDVKSLATGRGVYATLLSAQGRILADFYVYADADRLWIDTDADLAAKAMAILRRYVIGDRVVIEASDVGAVSLQGPESRRLLRSLFAMGSETGPALQDELSHAAAAFDGQPARVVRRSSTGEEGYEVWLESAALRRFWRRALQAGIVACGAESLESLRIEAGIARYGPDFGEDTLPLEAGLLNALSFSKGCYIGQEIVERARSRGHVNWKLVGLRFGPDATVPVAGQKLRGPSGAEIGEITSACVSPSLGRPLALGYVRREVSEPGTSLNTAAGAAAEVVVLPFVIAGGT